MTALTEAARWAERASRWLGWITTVISALAVAAIVLVLVASSAQRYLLQSPIPATEEIAAYLFVILAFLSVVGGFVDRRHIRVLPLWHRLPVGVQGWAILLGHAAAIAVLAVLIEETFAFAWSSRAYGARSYVADLLEWPWMMVIPVALGLFALVLALRIVIDLERILRREPPPEARRQVEGEPF